MLRKITLITLITLLISLVLLAAGLAVLDWYLGTERFRQRLALLITNAYGYEVTFQGDLGVSVYPWLGLETGPLEIRARPGEEPLLKAAEVSAKVAVIPLFSNRLEFDTVFLNQIDVLVQRDEDGATNVDELVKLLLPQREVKAVTDPTLRVRSVRVQGVQLHNGRFRFEDRSTGHTWSIDDAGFQTGEYQPGKPLPFSLSGVFARTGLDAVARLDLSGNLDVDLENKSLVFADSRINLILMGDDLPMQGKEVHLTSRLDLDSNEQTLRLTDYHLKLPQVLLSGDMRLDGFSRDAMQVRGRVVSGSFSPRDAVNDFFPGTIPEKDTGIFANGRFALEFDLTPESLQVQKLKVFCDQTMLSGQVFVKNFADPVYGFALRGDQLDFDRYYRLFVVDEPFYVDDFFPDFFQSATAEGNLELESVLLGGETLHDSRWEALCGGGVLRVDLPRAGLHDGSVSGSFQADIFPAEDQKGYALGLQMGLQLKEQKLVELPLLGAALEAPRGTGSMSIKAEMPSTVFQGRDVMDDVLLGVRGELGYALRSVRMTTGRGSDQRIWRLGNVEIQTDFSGLGERSGSERYAFSLKGGGKGADKEYSAWCSLAGRLSMRRDYSDMRLDGVQLRGRYEGGDLPEYAPAVDFSVSGALRAQSQRLSLRDVRVGVLGGELQGTMEGHRIFEEDFTLTGQLGYDSAKPMHLLRWLTLKPGTPRGKKAYTSLQVATQYSVTPNKAVFHHCEIGMDGSVARGVVRIEDYDTAKLTFDLSADRVDIDQYRPADKVRRDPRECVDPTQVRPISLPLETLRDLNAEGTLRVKDLLLYKLHFTDLKTDVLARDGQLSTSSLRGTFYGGGLQGGFTARAAKEFIVMSLNLKADDLEVGPFMADVGGKEYVMGRGSIFLDVQSLGRTDDDIIANLDGRGGFSITEGSYKFSGKGGRERIQEGDRSIMDSRNRFAGAGALFRIEDGGFYNEDFNMESTFMDLSGSGNFNINTNTIDLDLVANYKAGPTVPLHIVGCLDDPAVEVPGGELITNTVRDLIGLPLKPFQYLRDLFF